MEYWLGEDELKLRLNYAVDDHNTDQKCYPSFQIKQDGQPADPNLIRISETYTEPQVDANGYLELTVGVVSNQSYIDTYMISLIPSNDEGDPFS